MRLLQPVIVKLSYCIFGAKLRSDMHLQYERYVLFTMQIYREVKVAIKYPEVSVRTISILYIVVNTCVTSTSERQNVTASCRAQDSTCSIGHARDSRNLLIYY
jgi:hypothetical protein